ncbi:MAG: type II secretion system protein [Phycisphaerae bacterium]
MSIPTVPSEARARSGFTLIELLVVVGIIAILIAILVPSLGRAKAVSRDAACASNVRQISIGLFAYATSYDNYLPAAQEVNPPNWTLGPSWHLRAWDFIMSRPYDPADTLAPFAYLTKTAFECPAADLKSRLGLGGYSTTDHRDNGYAINVSTPGVSPQNGRMFALSVTPQQDNLVRAEQYHRINLVANPSHTLMMTDAQGFWVEYFDRGANLNQIAVLTATPNAGKMLDAVGRHGKELDAWNMAFFDGSSRLVHFKDVPGTPSQYYSVPAWKNPEQLLSAPDVPAETKVFWTGQLP